MLRILKCHTDYQPHKSCDSQTWYTFLLFKLLSILHVHSWHSYLSLCLWGPWSSNVLAISFVFLGVRGPTYYENSQCYFSVGLPRTVCTFVSLTLDNILQQYVPQNTVAKFFPNFSLLLISLDYYHPSVLANETLSVSICCEIDNVFGAVRTCFDHVLSTFSGFSWERILFLKCTCVNMVMQI